MFGKKNAISLYEAVNSLTMSCFSEMFKFRVFILEKIQK